MNTQDKFDLFIEGLLSKKETEKLKKQLNDDPALFSEFKKYAEATYLLKQELTSPLLNDEDDMLLKSLSLEQKLKIDNDVTEHFKRLKSDFQTGEKEFRETISSIVKRNSKRTLYLKIQPFFKIAAAFIIIFSASVLVISRYGFSKKQISSLAAFQKFYDPLNDKTLKTYGQYDNIFRNAIIAFRNADFEVASSRLDEIAKDYDTEYKYHILKGLILLENGQTENAKELFKTAMLKSESESKYVAEWYLGLAYLKENRNIDALNLFTDLSKVNNPYQKGAKRILKKVKRE